MEQTNPPHAPDQQAGSVIGKSARPQRPDDLTDTEGADSTTLPIDDTGFEPV